MRPTHRMGRTLLLSALFFYVASSAAGAVTFRMLAVSAPSRPVRVVHTIVIGSKDLLLDGIHIGQRILIGAVKLLA